MSMPTSFRERGFYRLATTMAWNPSVAIFPRFQQANYFNLLFLQSEICEIELELFKAIKDDSESENPKLYSCNFEALRKEGRSSTEFDLCLRLSEKLEKYNQATACQAAIDRCADPTIRDYEFLREFLKYSNMDGSGPHDAGSDTWDDTKFGGRALTDLLALSKANSCSDALRHLKIPGHDLLARILQLKPSYFFPEEEEHSYKMYRTAASITRLGNTLITLTASILILVPIIVLHFVTASNWRLGLIVAFTLAFTLAMTLTTEAKRSEIFAAAAAFTAVQVVYVGNV